MSDGLSFLQAWFTAHCDEDWEHDHRIRIENLDNPGWWVWISLAETEAEGRVLAGVRLERSETDWLDYKADGQEFTAACGSRNLDEALLAFKEFIAHPS
jgi:hypothetical protein